MHFSLQTVIRQIPNIRDMMDYLRLWQTFELLLKKSNGEASDIASKVGSVAR